MIVNTVLGGEIITKHSAVQLFLALQEAMGYDNKYIDLMLEFVEQAKEVKLEDILTEYQKFLMVKLGEQARKDSDNVIQSNDEW